MINIKQYKDLMYFSCFEIHEVDRTYISSIKNDVNYDLIIIYYDGVSYWKQLDNDNFNISEIYDKIISNLSGKKSEREFLGFHYCKESDSTEDMKKSNIEKRFKNHIREQKFKRILDEDEK